MKKGISIALGIIGLIICLATSGGATKCDHCGDTISGTSYTAYGSTYCYSCAHRLYPNATWK